MTADSSATGPLRRLRASLDDRTFFRRGMVTWMIVSGAIFAVLHALGVVAGLLDFFSLEGVGAMTYVAALASAFLGILASIVGIAWTLRRAGDIASDSDPSLLRLGLWIMRVGIEVGALWLAFSVFTTGIAMIIAGAEGPIAATTVYASGMELIVENALGFDFDGEGWFRLFGIVVFFASVLVGYMVLLCGYFVVDLVRTFVDYYGGGGRFFERRAAASGNIAPGQAPSWHQSLAFLGGLTGRIDDRSLFGSTLLALVRIAVALTALGLVGAALGGLFEFYDGGSSQLEHGLSRVFALLVPMAMLVVAAALVIWTEVSRSLLRQPDLGSGALGLALSVVQLFVEYVAIVATIGYAALGLLILLTGEDVFILLVGIVGQGIGSVADKLADLGSGGWFGSRVLGVLLVALAGVFGLLYAFAGYVAHDALRAVIRFFQRAAEFFVGDAHAED